MQTICFYGEIREESVKDLIEEVTDAVAKEVLDEEPPARELRLFITSEGGSLPLALHAHDVIRQLCAEGDVHLTTVASGYCQSAANVILQAGDIRYSMPHTFFMVHPPFQEIWSEEGIEFAELGERAHLWGMTVRVIATIFARRTGKDLDYWIREIQQPGRRFMLAADARAYGLVDEILESADEYLSRRPA